MWKCPGYFLPTGVDGSVKYDFGKVDASLFKRKNNKRYQDNLQNNVESTVN
jgi:hypothetical protein